jgi:hypothetical protein
MWIVIATLIVGDVLVAALWMRERQRHRKSRAALDYWRRLHGPAQAPTKAYETDMATMREDLRRRVHHYRAGRVPSGDAA